MKIIFFGTTQEEADVLSGLLKESTTEVIFIEEPFGPTTVSHAIDADIISVFVGSLVTPQLIDMMPELKHISTRSTGYDHIDSVYAASKGITVSNIPSYGSHTVAEFTFALLLDLSRKVSGAVRQIREEANFDISHFRGFDLNGKTIGVVGTGRIGKNVIQIARGFGMNVLAFDVYPDLVFAQEHNVTYMPLVDVVSQSDVITIHTPYTKETFHLINKDIFAVCKKGAYFLNTARGEIVDTEALVWALKEKIIAGAGLDVLEGERTLKEEADFLFGDQTALSKGEQFKVLLEDHMLIDMPQVIVTPHIAFSSKEAEAEILKTTATNILSVVQGSPQNLIKI